MALLVIGSIGLDRVETPFGSTEEELGGSAVYFSLAAAQFSPVRLVGVVGRDFPASCRGRLAARQIDLEGLLVADGETFRWHGAYEGRMDQARTVAVHMNVLGAVEPAVPAGYRDSRYVFLANGPPASHLSALSQVCAPAFVMADTMNYYIANARDGLLEVMQRIDALILNDAEAIQLSGEPSLLGAARWVCDHGPTYCVVKKGEHGSLLRGPGGTFVLPGFPHERVVDPTGAGDAFAGGLMGYVAAQGDVALPSLKRGLAYGTVTASFAIERLGPAALEGLDAAALEARLAEFVRATHLTEG